MKGRKPDLMVVLAVLVCLGVLFTGISQAMMRDTAPAPISSSR